MTGARPTPAIIFSIRAAVSLRPRSTSSSRRSGIDADKPRQFLRRPHAPDANGHGAGAIKDRSAADYAAEQNDSGLRDAAVAVVDHEMIGAPESECTG